MATQTLSAAERIGVIGSPYHNQAKEVVEKKKEVVQPQMLLGILRALKENPVNGYLETITESIHGEIYGDILDQADRLF